jgi:hypothetical protein
MAEIPVVAAAGKPKATSVIPALAPAPPLTEAEVRREHRAWV